ncbi:Ssb Single-stranded DNA-binding protein [uncultured Caudovirales phage]|uniref:Single-stranded DNA-binding protein n=1 Tax=uncultured Caudovirales phage TaxID=2100421 RepID=A0A6J5SFV1_9CAUD|nr:Ssb Single-stranded DNA-binding protein [uncultured Caudovirales phage]CAB4212625.1 Ssb Single-stranded DNA-binding protein [uncultured Caudovirales phage]
MAKSLNQVTIMGNLTRSPELKQTPSGQSVAAFSLALNRSYKNTADEWVEATDYVDITAWGQLAEQISQRLDTGSRVLVSGRLQSRSWEKDGVKRSKLEVLAMDVTFLDKIEEQNS